MGHELEVLRDVREDPLRHLEEPPRHADGVAGVGRARYEPAGLIPVREEAHRPAGDRADPDGRY